ncbi:dihydrofolate reductase [candidate division TA06 bacterium]|uniref:Dihydrofolate reductase n=1 Tax=candidate division TA06 bacterium TaxID=2250710 RepID=A0A933IBN5_UNCT6|nr:dihydrofolate reductase [candidate division TA06 bacterium]
MSGPEKIIIVAMTRGRVIGLNGKMPWHIPADLKLFKKLTLGGTVIMGRTTYDSIGKPLPQRNNIIVSATVKELPGATVCPTFEEAVKKAEGFGRDIFFIGGASIYQQALAMADQMHVSWVKQDFEGDTYFPEFDLNRWQETETKEYPEFTHIGYRRK